MSIELMAVVWKLDMPPSRKLVALSLADNANDTGDCWPSVANICARTSLAERTVQAAIRELEQTGFLVIRAKSGSSNRYHLTPAAYAPPQDLHPAADAPTPAIAAPPPPQQMHPTPATAAPRTIIEPSDEPSRNPKASLAVVSRETDLPDADEIGQAAARVFAHWRDTWGHPRAVFDAKRRKLVRNRLREYSEADLCQAITGYRNSPWHTGQNPNGTVYDSIETLLRDAGQVDRGLKFYAEPPYASGNSKQDANVAAGLAWLAQGGA